VDYNSIFHERKILAALTTITKINEAIPANGRMGNGNAVPPFPLSLFQHISPDLRHPRSSAANSSRNSHFLSQIRRFLPPDRK